jgi:hypothetical protein
MSHKWGTTVVRFCTWPLCSAHPDKSSLNEHDEPRAFVISKHSSQTKPNFIRAVVAIGIDCPESLFKTVRIECRVVVRGSRTGPVRRQMIILRADLLEALKAYPIIAVQRQMHTLKLEEWDADLKYRIRVHQVDLSKYVRRETITS